MSVESDKQMVIGAYPKAHAKQKTTTGGAKITEHVILSGTSDDLPVGPQAFTEEKAWRYAAERLERNDGANE